MANKRKYSERNSRYQETMYERQQMRDTLKGPVQVKNMGELYLPMPSGWLGIQSSPMQMENSKANSVLAGADYLPWKHSNPAYRAYLTRARFPDIVANSLRMCIGVTSKYESKVELPESMEYLDENASSDGKSLDELYAYLISEVLSVSKIAIAVGYYEKTGQFYIATYVMESNIDWSLAQVIEGERIQLVMTKFIEGVDAHGEEEIKEFFFGPTADNSDEIKVQSKLYTSTDQDPVGVPLSFRGKDYDEIPVYYAGAFSNDPGPENIPLISISDIAISLYQEDADLRQAHFMTCNPTLFLFGIRADEKPSVVGSNVTVSVTNPQARAEYPATDTSALDHVKNYMDGLKQEASEYAASILVSSAKESGEALSIRQANRGASLVHIVNCVSRAMTKALQFIARMTNQDERKVKYEGSVEFAEALLNAQDLTALVSAWISGAGVDMDILIDNLRAANYIKDGRTNEEIKKSLAAENPPADPEIDEDPDLTGPGKQQKKEVENVNNNSQPDK